MPRSGSRRPDDRLQFWGLGAVSKRLVCGSSGPRAGLPLLEQLREKTEGRQRAGGTSALPKASSSALCLGRPARAAALSRAVACPKPPDFAAAARRSRRASGAVLVWGTRGQRMEEASGLIGRVIAFCGLETSPAASGVSSVCERSIKILAQEKKAPRVTSKNRPISRQIKHETIT